MNIMNAAVIRPGDTLIIAFDQHVEDDDVEHIRSTIKERLDIEVAIVEGATGLAVYRPTPNTEPEAG